MRHAAASLLLAVLFASAPALAAPPEGDPAGERDPDSIVSLRAEMRAEYEQRKEERRQAILDAAAETSGGTDAIRGWKDESTGRLPAARVVTPPGTVPQDPPSPPPPKSDFPLLVVGAGVVLVLVLKVFLPWVFEVGIVGLIRRRKEEIERSSGAQTITLRPRKQRLRDANRGG